MGFRCRLLAGKTCIRESLMDFDDFKYEPEPTGHDLEDQIARNTAYNTDLEHALATIRSQSIQWYAAAFLCFSAVLFLGLATFSPSRLEPIIFRSDVGLTVLTTILSLALAASVACFWQLLTLRRLANEAFRVSQINTGLIMDARAFLEDFR